MSSWMHASLAARWIAASGSVESHSERFSRTLPSNRKMSWSTIAKELASCVRAIESRPLSSKSTSPSHGRYSPLMSLATVDLPLPDGPTMATRSPGERRRLKSVSSGGAILL